MSINKNFLKSKTMWVSLIIALVTTVLPDTKQFIIEHPDYVSYAVGFIFGLLRITTTKALTVKES